MNTFWIRHQVSLLVFVGVLVLIALSNLWTWRHRLSDYLPPPHFPHLSVLIPARDEEANIGACVHSLLSQDYPCFEVMVLDDQSTDSTRAILMGLAANERRLQVFAGQPLPAGWLGKHWACHQLAQLAQGELLLFVDADTRYEPHVLRHAVAALLAEQADLLAVLPGQQVCSWAERLVLPVLCWSIFSFLPLAVAYRLRWPALSAAVGQFMLFRRQAYDAVGGHAAVRQDIVDDLALGRRVKAHGLRWRLLDGRPQIYCRMYRNFRGVYDGFGKSLFAAFGYNPLLFSFVWLYLLLLFLEPLFVLVLASCEGVGLMLSTQVALGTLALSVLSWAIVDWRFGFPLYLALLYPLTILLTAIIAFRSMVITLLGRGTWKGRRLLRDAQGK